MLNGTADDSYEKKQALLKKARVPIFYGWWIVVAGFIVQAVNGGALQHSFGAFLVPLKAEFGWSRTLLSGAYSFARVETGSLGPLQGWLVNRFGPRLVLVVGLAIFGVGYILFSRINGVLTFYLTFILMSLGSSLGGLMTVSPAVVNWFSRRRATALGIAMSGMSVGGLMVPAVAWALNNLGWRHTSVILGLVVMAVGIPAALVIRHRPERYGLRPDGAVSPVPPEASGQIAQGVSETSEPIVAEYSFTTREALRTSAFWFLAIGHALALVIVGAVQVHQIPHMVQSVGLSLEEAGGIVAILTTTSLMGQLTGGYIGDRINKRVGIIACMGVHTIAMVVFAFATSVPQAIAFAMLQGAAWGIRGPLVISIRADYFGPKSYATIMGFGEIINTTGIMSGPLLAGFMADQIGNYRLSFLVLALVPIVGAGFFLLARRPVRPLRRLPQEAQS